MDDSSAADDNAWLEPLSPERCLALLRDARVGRVAFNWNGGPMVLPVNYRLAETETSTWIAIRTRPGSLLDRAEGMAVAFEIDGIDPSHMEGWSVVVRGMVHRIDADAAGLREQFDSQPWMLEERDVWLIIDTYSIAGRRLHAAGRDWPFDVDGYL